MEKDYIVYLHTNNINGKKYIGMTSLLPEKRWQNGNGYKRQPLFYNEILKFGWENFSHEILIKNLNRSEAKIKEAELIELYKTNNVEYGYNINKADFSEDGQPIYKHYTKKNNRIIHCIELDKNYTSASEAKRDTGIDNSCILKACKGERASAGKHPITNLPLHWEFIDLNQKERQ